MKMTGMVNNELLLSIKTYECKLGWLINLIAYVVKGEKFSSNQMEKQEELLDAELSKRVFSLNHSINYRMNSVWFSFYCSDRQTTRESIHDWRLASSTSLMCSEKCRSVNGLLTRFSSFSRQGIADSTLTNIPIISGIKMIVVFTSCCHI